MIDDHYDRVRNDLMQGKDSIFEPCKIMSFDPKTLTATISFLRSGREKENVILLFPSLSIDSAQIAVPKNGTTALAFWGPDRQAFVLPAQFILPNYSVEDGIARQDASLEQFDRDLSFVHLEAGEYFLKHCGSYMYMNTLGDIELMTRSMVSLRLEESGMLRGTMDGYDWSGPLFEERTELAKIEGREGQRKIERYLLEQDGFSEQDPRQMADVITRYLGQAETIESLEAVPDLPADELIRIETGIVPSDDDETMWERIDDERVVKRIRMGHGTIWIGEEGTLRYQKEGLQVKISDDVHLTLGEKTYSMQRLIERVERLSEQAGIEEVLYDEG